MTRDSFWLRCVINVGIIASISGQHRLPHGKAGELRNSIFRVKFASAEVHCFGNQMVQCLRATVLSVDVHYYLLVLYLAL